MYKVIASGSKGNAVIYHGSIMVDCGVPFKAVEPYMHDLQIVLLTHIHGDHFNPSTIRRLASERPGLRFGCCEWMVPYLGEWVKNLDVYHVGIQYEYEDFMISPVKLFHDVPNCGYRIFKDDKKIFHATDTAHMEGITAKNYDLYAIEHNYDEETIDGIISRKLEAGEFSHQRESINGHLSEQKARDFIFNNKKENSEVLRLHESLTNY
jgi:ribonuclease BN (tRNA processing enzyme)